MAWTAPKTWASEPLTSVDLNAEIRDNFNYLYDRIENSDTFQITSNYSTSSGSFVDVDATDLSLTLTTNGGNVLCGFFAPVYNDVSGNRTIYFDVDVDGTRFANSTNGIVSTRFSGNTSGDPDLLGFVVLITGLSAESHIFTLQWKADSSGANINGGNSAAQFWVQEI